MADPRLKSRSGSSAEKCSNRPMSSRCLNPDDLLVLLLGQSQGFCPTVIFAVALKLLTR